jgi:hypothetical protein
VRVVLKASLSAWTAPANAPRGDWASIRFGCDAAIVGDLEQSVSCKVHGGEGGLLQADPFKPSKLPQLSVHASALDVPGLCGAEST